MAYTFADLFEHSVDAMPDRRALIVSGKEVTYRELDERANRLAHHFLSVGFGSGTHIGIQMHNSIETMVAVLASFKIRAVPITVNYRYTTDELVYLYDNADLEALVFHRGTRRAWPSPWNQYRGQARGAGAGRACDGRRTARARCGCVRGSAVAALSGTWRQRCVRRA